MLLILNASGPLPVELRKLPGDIVQGFPADLNHTRSIYNRHITLYKQGDYRLSKLIRLFTPCLGAVIYGDGMERVRRDSGFELFHSGFINIGNILYIKDSI